jgi:hypothetical protein
MSILPAELKAKFDKVQPGPLYDFLKKNLKDQYKGLAPFFAYYISFSIEPIKLPNVSWWRTNIPWWNQFFENLGTMFPTFIQNINQGTCFPQGTKVAGAVQCLLKEIQSLITNSVPADLPLPSDLRITKNASTNVITVNLKALKEEDRKIFATAVYNILRKPSQEIVEETVFDNLIDDHPPTPLGQVAFTALLLLLFL